MVKMTLGVDGMMCNMCEAHVNEAIRNAFTVKKVSSSQEIPEEKLSAVIGETGYKLTSYQSEPYQKRGLFG